MSDLLRIVWHFARLHRVFHVDSLLASNGIDPADGAFTDDEQWYCRTCDRFLP